MRAGLRITRLAALSQPRTCDLRNARPTHCLCGCIRSGVTRCTRLMMCYFHRMCQCRLHTVPRSHIGILMRHLAAEPRSPAGLCSPLNVPLERSCLPRIRWCLTGGFQEQGQCFFIGLCCSIPTIVFYYFSFSPLTVNGLVLCGWSLRTDRLYITLSQPCTADLF